MNWGSSITYLAEARVKGEWKRFGVKDADRLAGLALVGKMGTGRAAFLANMALQDAARGMGILILDGAGNLAHAFLERLPKEHTERLIVLDPSDGEHPYSWNPLDDFRALARDEAVARLSDTLADMYDVPESAPVRFAAAMMLARREATLLLLHELVDPKVREKWLPAGSPERQEWESLAAKEPEVAAAIEENGRFIAKDVLMRNLLGQTESKFGIGVLAKGGIVVVDFSHIRMFPTRIKPLVRLFLHGAEARASFENPSAVYMHDALKCLSLPGLEEALLDRAIAFAISDTTRGEEDTAMREHLLHRAGSVLSFSPHDADAPLVERVFYPYVAPEELEKLEDGQLVLALAIDSVRSRPFFARALPPLPRSGLSPLDLALESRNNYTLVRLTVDKMFRPKPKEEKKEEGGFSNAFRSMFSKSAAPGAGATDAKAPAAAPAAGAPSVPAKTSPPKPPEEKKEPAAEAKHQPARPKEIPEAELKKMVKVRRIKPKSE